MHHRRGDTLLDREGPDLGLGTAKTRLETPTETDSGYATPDRRGDAEAFGQQLHRIGDETRTRNHSLASVCDSPAGTRPPDPEFEGILIGSLQRILQDGRDSPAEVLTEEGGEDVQGGPEECIHISDSTPAVSQVSDVHVERADVSLQDSTIRFEHRAVNIHKTNSSGSGAIAQARYSPYRIPG